MGESLLGKYQRLLGEAKNAKPAPAVPITDLDVDVGQEDITLTRTDQKLRPDDIQRAELAFGTQHPSVLLTVAQLDAVCAFWAEIKKALQG